MGRKNPIEKWMDLSVLPRKTKNRINWKESIGYKCSFKYDDIEGEIEIVGYNTPKLTVKYLDYDLFKIDTAHFQKCKLGKLLKKCTNEFKVKIGTNFKDTKRDLTIIDKEYKKEKNEQIKKYYKYHCNKCENEDWIVEADLITTNRGCNTCCVSPQKAVLGINTIWDTDRWMVNLGVSEQDAKKYTHGSRVKIKVICPDCGNKKTIAPSTIYSVKSIQCGCKDGNSYPEKFMKSLLNQLKIDYITQYSPQWVKPKRYDFYFKINDKQYIVETHGGQHYEKNGFHSYDKGKSLQEIQQNDFYKKDVALKNGIDTYIELDCRESNLKWIKKSIVNSELNKIFNLNSINWLECEKFSLSNRIKEVCDYWRLHNEINNEEITIADLSKEFKLSGVTISTYLRKGNNLKWCYYNDEEAETRRKRNSAKANIERDSKQVEIFKNGISLGVFCSCNELSRQSEKLFGVKLHATSIGKVAKGEKKHEKGYVFKYTDDLTDKIDINPKIEPGRKVEISKDGVSLGIFNSCSELEKQSEELFNITLRSEYISRVARGERKTYKGYSFKYITERSVE